MKSARTSRFFVVAVVALIFAAETIVPVNSFPAPQKEEVDGGTDADIETMVEEMRETGKINPMTFQPLARKLLLMKLQQEVKRSWRQCTFNAVSCFG